MFLKSLTSLIWCVFIEQSVFVATKMALLINDNHTVTGGSRLSQIFWEHENLSGLSVIEIISTNLH